MGTKTVKTYKTMLRTVASAGLRVLPSSALQASAVPMERLLVGILVFFTQTLI